MNGFPIFFMARPEDPGLRQRGGRVHLLEDEKGRIEVMLWVSA